MDFIWIPATMLAFASYILATMRTGKALTISMICALLVFSMAGAGLGYWIWGSLNTHTAMNYYYAGEANGYNRASGYSGLLPFGSEENMEWLEDDLRNIH